MLKGCCASERFKTRNTFRKAKYKWQILYRIQNFIELRRIHTVRKEAKVPPLIRKLLIVAVTAIPELSALRRPRTTFPPHWRILLDLSRHCVL